MYVIVIENDEDVAEQLLNRLRRIGHATDLFRDADEALVNSELIRNADALIVDLALGAGFNGFEFAERIVDELGLAAERFVFFSAYWEDFEGQVPLQFAGNSVVKKEQAGASRLVVQAVERIGGQADA